MSSRRIFHRFSIVHHKVIWRFSRRRCVANVQSSLDSENPKPQRTPTLPPCLNTLGLTYLEPDELRQRFDEYDADHTGSINLKEAQQILVMSGNKDATVEEAQMVVDSMDIDHNGKIEWKEFKAAVDKV